MVESWVDKEGVEKTFERLGRNNAYQKSTKKQMHADFLKRELLRRPGTISETGQKIVLERKNNSSIFVVFFFTSHINNYGYICNFFRDK